MILSPHLLIAIIIMGCVSIALVVLDYCYYFARAFYIIRIMRRNGYLIININNEYENTIYFIKDEERVFLSDIYDAKICDIKERYRGL